MCVCVSVGVSGCLVLSCRCIDRPTLVTDLYPTLCSWFNWNQLGFCEFVGSVAVNMENVELRSVKNRVYLQYSTGNL